LIVYNGYEHAFVGIDQQKLTLKLSSPFFNLTF
jgi:hypothetical protein